MHQRKCAHTQSHILNARLLAKDLMYCLTSVIALVSVEVLKLHLYMVRLLTMCIVMLVGPFIHSFIHSFMCVCLCVCVAKKHMDQLVVLHVCLCVWVYLSVCVCNTCVSPTYSPMCCHIHQCVVILTNVLAPHCHPKKDTNVFVLLSFVCVCVFMCVVCVHACVCVCRAQTTAW